MSWETIHPSHRVITRRVNRCSYCDEPIPKGAPALVWVGKMDGDIYRCWAHPACPVLYAELGWDDYDELGEPFEFRCEAEYRLTGPFPWRAEWHHLDGLEGDDDPDPDPLLD